MKDNKKVQTIQSKLTESIQNREIAKVRYDAHVLIVEGQRRTLSELESMNQKLLSDLMDIGNVVSEFNKQLQIAINEAQEQEKEDNKE